MSPVFKGVSVCAPRFLRPGTGSRCEWRCVPRMQDTDDSDLPLKRHMKRPRTVTAGALQPCSAVLALEVHQLLQDLVRGGDDAGVGLEAALGDDPVGELLGQVHVGHFQGPWRDGTEVFRACCAHSRLRHFA